MPPNLLYDMEGPEWLLWSLVPGAFHPFLSNFMTSPPLS
jgi:hypothetical protein